MMKNLIFVFLIIIALLSVGGFKVQAKVEDANSIVSLHVVLKKKLWDLDKDFSILYKGSEANIDSNLASAIPTLIKNSRSIQNNLKTYSYKGKYTDEGLLITYRMSYYTTVSKENAAEKEMDKQAKIIKKNHSTVLQQVKAVNDYIVKNTEYGDLNGDAAYTKYGITHNRMAVCQGYALATEYLLEKLNIPSEYVVGESRGRKHAWNKVRINKHWYNIDTTWNDTKRGNVYSVSYKYFLVSDKVLRKDHSWNGSNYPVANSENFDFLNDSSSMEIHRGMMYFSYDRDNQKMYVYNMSNGTAKKITNTRVQYLVYAKNKIYFRIKKI